MADTITFETTKGHASFAALQEHVNKSADTPLNDLFTGELRKTLLQTAQIKVEVVVPFGDSQDNDYTPYYMVYFMSEGKLQAKRTKFKSDLMRLLDEIYAQLAIEPSTRLKLND